MRNFSTRSIFVLLVLMVGLQATVNAQQPRIRFNLPAGGFQDVCIQAATAAVTVEDNDDILIIADAAAGDLGCPGQDPIINSVSATPGVLDITSLNCDLDNNGTDDSTCLFLNWNITPGISDTTCDVVQIQPPSEFSMSPFQFSNPSSFVDPANPTVFAATVNGLEWPVNLANATAGSKQFRLTCSSVGGTGPVSSVFSSTFMDGADPIVTIDTFNIVETTAERGTDSITFQWNVTLSNGPTAPTCTLSSPGTINNAVVNVTAAPGQGSANILAGSPLGSRNFTFSCRPDAGSAVTDTATDTVTITEEMATPCPAPVVPNRDSSRTTYQSVFGSIWPGPNGDNRNITVNTNQYLALSFVATASQVGSLSSIAPSVANIGASIIALDRCPGIVDTTVSACSSGAAVKNAITWRSSDVASNTGCELEVGETYFLNIFFGNTNGSNNCGFSNCVTRLNNGHNTVGSVIGTTSDQ